MPATLRLDGAAVVIRIRNQNFELKAASQDLRIPSDITGNLNARVKLEFHLPYDRAVPLGTPRQLLTELQTLIGRVPLGLADTERLENQWDQMVAEIRRAPVLSQLSSEVLNTNISVTDLVIDLEFTRQAGEAGTFAGTFSVGILFTPPGTAKVLGASIVRAGTMITLKVNGSTNDASALGFVWPNQVP